MGAVRDIPRRRTDDEDTSLQRRAGELRLARFHRTRDAAERDALFERYLPLARSLAARYRHTSEPFDDLLQVASIGLLKAIERYDPARGYAFSSFAVPTILGELRRHLRDHTWSVHVPRDLQELGPAPRTRDRRALAASSGARRRSPRSPSASASTRRQVLDAREAVAAHSPGVARRARQRDDAAATLVRPARRRRRRARHAPRTRS